MVCVPGIEVTIMKTTLPSETALREDPAGLGSAGSGAPDNDPYQLRPEEISEPPQSIWGILRQTGPGITLAASIVGSGELIATTTLGAQVGYAALWIILLSCFIKPILQAEWGRYTIATGETGLESFNRVPGPRLLRVNWIVWLWAVMILIVMMQVGAMLGGVSQVMHLLVPAIPVPAWVLIFLALTLLLLLGGGYQRVERLAMVKVGLFTLLTILAAVVLLRMPQYFSWRDCLEGFKFELPGAGISTALAVFGITGVGASELFMYPYWCVEKGYARFTGRRTEGADWQRRARGWVRVMHVDIIASMFIYTGATLAFYLLGAGVLHGMGLVPAANDMIPVLSNIYTQTLGEWALWPFYAGAIVTLYGTVFASTAANSRVYADMCRLIGLFSADDYVRRLRYQKAFVVLLTVLPAMLFLFFASPIKMVVIGGIAQAMMLPVIGIGTLYLRHRRLPRGITPAGWVTVGLWVASFIIICITAYYVVLELRKL
jgi:Mn2+/Fe2+ NRAMP family transporter